MNVRVVCSFCGFGGELLDPPAVVRRLVAEDVGHPMHTLTMAIEHICCPRCDRTRLKRASSTRPDAPASEDLTAP